jgi:hypothetical protein
VARVCHEELVRDLILDGTASAAPLQHTDSLGLDRTSRWVPDSAGMTERPHDPTTTACDRR